MTRNIRPHFALHFPRGGMVSLKRPDGLSAETNFVIYSIYGDILLA